jgi:hypothetical protein
LDATCESVREHLESLKMPGFFLKKKTNKQIFFILLIFILSVRSVTVDQSRRISMITFENCADAELLYNLVHRSLVLVNIPANQTEETIMVRCVVVSLIDYTT